jgi:hypothetical protein
MRRQYDRDQSQISAHTSRPAGQGTGMLAADDGQKGIVVK